MEPFIHWVPRFSSGVRRPEFEVTHLHQMPKLRMSGIMPQLSPYDFIEKSGKTSLLTDRVIQTQLNKVHSDVSSVPCITS